MIIYCNDSDIDALTKCIENLEVRFWVNYRYYQKDTRDHIERCFDEIKDLIDKIKNEDQIEMEI